MKALSVLYAKVVGRDIDPYSEVLVTSGAMQALFSVILGNIDDGDEVIIIEPFFDAYEPIIQMAGGKVRYVQLKLVRIKIFLVLFGLIFFSYENDYFLAYFLKLASSSKLVSSSKLASSSKSFICSIQLF